MNASSMRTIVVTGGGSGIGRASAVRLGGTGARVLVNAVAPGMVRTPMLAGMSAERLDGLAAGYPGGRLPEAEDIAQAVAFFADPATRFVTGQVLIVDGGRSVGLSAG